MLDPPPQALRRRARELSESADREMANDPDSAALLLFYAAECGLKAAYMLQNNLRHTGESRGGRRAARDYKHNIQMLIADLRVPAASVGSSPTIYLVRTSTIIQVPDLHQAWRYGEKVHNMSQACEWLIKIIAWARQVS